MVYIYKINYPYFWTKKKKKNTFLRHISVLTWTFRTSSFLQDYNPPSRFFTHPLRLFFSSLYLATVHVLGSSFSCMDCKPYCFKEDTYGHNYNFIGYLCKLIRWRIIKARTSKKCSAFSINWENALKVFF